MAIWNLGSVNADLVYRLPHLPAPGETLAALSHQRGPGGKGAHMSVAAGRRGGPSAVWGADCGEPRRAAAAAGSTAGTARVRMGLLNGGRQAAELQRLMAETGAAGAPLSVLEVLISHLQAAEEHLPRVRSAVEGAAQRVTDEPLVHGGFLEASMQLELRIKGRFTGFVLDKFQAKEKPAPANVPNVWVLGKPAH